MKKLLMLVCAVTLWSLAVYGQVRAFNSIFPHLDTITKAAIFSPHGFVQACTPSSLPILSQSLLDTAIATPILSHNFKLMAEVVAVIQEQTDFTHLYNALGNISGLNGRVYQKPAQSGKYFYLFDEISRITATSLLPLPDPAPASEIPLQDTFYLRLKDPIFGYSYYRVVMVRNAESLVYTLTNYKPLFYYFVPVMREGDFRAQVYLELIDEGILAYSIAGVAVPDFFVSLMDIAPAIENRMEALIQWIVEGL
ncbi:MAG: hypothetical protein LBO67_05825 [Spirochaetaceae bacterium]|jgi:hypothetical protein|nr:hypothetical protein [Spirochaetaceae bacterium]